VVYEAYDRNVHREVALKRLLDPQSLQGGVSPRVLQSRFFAEARTLAGVRSPFVVSLLDVQARHRFIALELCRGGNLRLALRRGLVGPDDLPRVGHQLQAALEAVHVAGAVHRDIKPSNILVRSPHSRSTIALADFGVAVGTSVLHKGGRAGTLRYLAPELRTERGQPSAATDRFSAGVVLLELAIAPAQLPASFDRLDGNLDAQSSIPETVPEPWGDVLRRLLATDPAERHW
jgi:serine/threonine protein kinase